MNAGSGNMHLLMFGFAETATDGVMMGEGMGVLMTVASTACDG